MEQSWVGRFVKAAAVLALLMTATFPLQAANGFAPGAPQITPSLETIGIIIPFSGDDNKNASVNIEYKLASGSSWRPGHPAARTPDRTLQGGLSPRFATRIFWLSEGQTYDVRMTYSDPDGVTGNTVVVSQVTTRTEPTPVTTNTFYIDPNSGNDSNPGTLAAPWRTLASVANGGSNELTPGDKLILRGGVYHEVEFEINNGGAGTPNNWIVLEAYPGETPIIDGSDPTLAVVDSVNNWTQSSTYPRIYLTTINYPDISGGISRVSWGPEQLWLAHYLPGEGYGLADLAADVSNQGHGWYFAEGPENQGTLYVWLPGSTDSNPIDPDTVPMYVPRTHFLARVTASDYVAIDGLTFRYGYRGLSVFTSSNVLVQNCRAHGAVYPIELRHYGQFNLFQDNEIFDIGAATVLPPLGPGTALYEWFKHSYPVEHQGFKVVDAGNGHVFRNNFVHDVFNGGIWEDDQGAELINMEIYGNVFRDILDDGMEPEGELLNVAIWDNRIEGALAGISGAPINTGPIFIMYNYIIDHSIRSLKFNHGNCTNCGLGEWFVYHNSSVNTLAHPDPDDGDGLRIPGFGEGMLVTSRNNIYHGYSRAIDDSQSAGEMSNKVRDFDYDALWATCTTACLENNGSARFVKWQRQNYSDLAEFQAGSCQQVGGCQEANGIQVDPMFMNAAPSTPARDKDLRLRAASPLIDRGVALTGINDVGPFQFSGNAPDIGAYEVPTGPPDTTPPTVPQGLAGNPASTSSINLSWSAASDPESGVVLYRVYRNGTLAGQPSATAFTDRDLAESTSYAYEVSARNGAGLESARSNPVSLTTLADTTPPTVVSVDASSGTEVMVVYGEPVETSSSTAVGNYQIDNGITVASATLAPDLKTVTLTTSALSQSVIYTLTINGVRDRASTPNTLAPNTTATFEYVNLVIFEVRIGDGADDVEQRGGSISVGSGDLELVEDGGGAQTVGVRFGPVNVPYGAIILNAYVQFKVDEVTTGSTSLLIEGENSDNAAPFGDVDSRSRTVSSVAWTPAAWSSTGVAGPDQRTPDVRSIIQEIVTRPGWVSGNRMVLIITGSGKRTAESYEGDSAGAPLLHVEYSDSPPTAPPDVPTGLVVQ